MPRHLDSLSEEKRALVTRVTNMHLTIKQAEYYTKGATLNVEQIEGRTRDIFARQLLVLGDAFRSDLETLSRHAPEKILDTRGALEWCGQHSEQIEPFKNALLAMEHSMRGAPKAQAVQEARVSMRSDRVSER